MSGPDRDNTRADGFPALTTRILRALETPPEWRTLLASSADVGFTHTPLWTETLCRRLPGRQGLWVMIEAEGRALGGLALLETSRGPLRVVEGHYDGTCGAPLLAGGLGADLTSRVVARLLDELSTLGRSPTVLTTALHLPPAWDGLLREDLLAKGFNRRDVQVAVIPLDQGLEYVESHVLKKNRRNERNKALRRGAVTGVTSDPAIIDEFYPIYLAATRRWGSTAVDRDLLTDLISGGDGSVFCVTVHYEGALLGAHFNIVDGDMITAWLAATDTARNKEFFPATLLVWADLEEACRRGAGWFDLGAHGGQVGVANFKRLIGAHEIIRGSYIRHSPGGLVWRGLRRLRQRWRF